MVCGIGFFEEEHMFVIAVEMKSGLDILNMLFILGFEIDFVWFTSAAGH